MPIQHGCGNTKHMKRLTISKWNGASGRTGRRKSFRSLILNLARRLSTLVLERQNLLLDPLRVLFRRRLLARSIVSVVSGATGDLAGEGVSALRSSIEGAGFLLLLREVKGMAPSCELVTEGNDFECAAYRLRDCDGGGMKGELLAVLGGHMSGVVAAVEATGISELRRETVIRLPDALLEWCGGGGLLFDVDILASLSFLARLVAV